MHKEISPELYNYNKFPGLEFKQVGTQVTTETIQFTLVENYREAFDIVVFNQRFSEILSKFDYVVGDWANDQLRLRGFYQDEHTQDKTEKISRLEDYLLEYCSYGCAYFVLENDHPQRASFDKKSQHRKDGKVRHKQKRLTEESEKQSYKENRKRHKRKRTEKKMDNNPSDTKRHFVIRQK